MGGILQANRQYGANALDSMQRLSAIETQREIQNKQIEQADKVAAKQMNSGIGGAAGGALGAVVGGPVGFMVGSALGGVIGGLFS